MISTVILSEQQCDHIENSRALMMVTKFKKSDKEARIRQKPTVVVINGLAVTDRGKK